MSLDLGTVFGSLRMRAPVYTRTATVAILVGWQVDKMNSPAFPFSILHRRRKRCVYIAQPPPINNYEQLGPQIEHSMDLFCKMNHIEATGIFKPSC